MKRKYKVFTTLSRNLRRKKTFKVKNLIRYDKLPCSKMFYTDTDVPLSLEIGNWCWCDITFLGQDPATYWNATIYTANTKFADLLEDAAFKESWNMLSEEERRLDTRFETTPNYNAEGKVISHTWVSKPRMKFEQFGGLTMNEHTDKRTVEIARDNPPAVHRGYRVLQGYRSGIGLEMIIDAEELTVEIIEKAIADFRAHGEKTWFNPEPAEVSYSGEPQLLAQPLRSDFQPRGGEGDNHQTQSSTPDCTDQ